MDKLVCLSTFVKVVDSGSFAAAADALNLSPPMVGRHVRTLEDSLGVQLLARTTRRQGLTEAGRVYYERAQAVLAEVEAADDSVARIRVAPRGMLRINAPVTVGTVLIAPILSDYLARYPEVRVELTLGNRIVDVVEEGYDAVIRTGDLPDSALIARPLGTYRLIACAAPHYLDRHGRPTLPGELAAHACLGFHPGAKSDTWTFFDAGGIETSVRVSGPLASDNGQVLREAAISGLGIVLQAEALLGAEIAAGRLIRVLDHHEPRHLRMQMLYSALRSPTPKLRSFLDFVGERLG